MSENLINWSKPENSEAKYLLSATLDEKRDIWRIMASWTQEDRIRWVLFYHPGLRLGEIMDELAKIPHNGEKIRMEGVKARLYKMTEKNIIRREYVTVGWFRFYAYFVDDYDEIEEYTRPR